MPDIFPTSELKASEKHCLKEIRWGQGENSVNQVLVTQLCGSDIGSLGISMAIERQLGHPQGKLG